jgi:hypothetical protein
MCHSDDTRLYSQPAWVDVTQARKQAGDTPLGSKVLGHTYVAAIKPIGTPIPPVGGKLPRESGGDSDHRKGVSASAPGWR